MILTEEKDLRAVMSKLKERINERQSKTESGSDGVVQNNGYIACLADIEALLGLSPDPDPFRWLVTKEDIVEIQGDKTEHPLRTDYLAFALFDRHGDLWEAQARKEDLESFVSSIGDDETLMRSEGPFRIKPVRITITEDV